MSSLKHLKCPICAKNCVWSTENPFRPFCSKRCKLIDLGEWADESRKIPGKSVQDDSFLTQDCID